LYGAAPSCPGCLSPFPRAFFFHSEENRRRCSAQPQQPKTANRRHFLFVQTGRVAAEPEKTRLGFAEKQSNPGAGEPIASDERVRGHRRSNRPALPDSARPYLQR